jgi:prefoldin subunit 5
MSLQEAVFILKDHEVVSGFWLTEFEQHIRHGDALAPFSATTLQAAYVQIGNHRCAESMVLFEIPLQPGADGEAVARSNWYMPLRRLADSAGRGPNMGAGRIKLACKSQCSISWHAESLWEPVTSDFMAVRKALRDNRLDQKVNTGSDVATTVLQSVSAVSAVERVTESVSATSLLAQKHSDPEVEALKHTLRNEVDAYRNQLQQLQQEIERQKNISEKLQRQAEQRLVEQATAAPVNRVAEDDREQMRQLHSQEVTAYQQQIEALRSELEMARLDAETSKLPQDDDAPGRPSGAEVESLQSEIESLSARIQVLEESSIDRFVSRVSGLDAVLVAFHPGAGHLTITPDNMKLYADNPVAYAAQKCFVSEETYRNWLDHYDDPRCQQCQAEIPRVEQPRDFEQRLSAFCKMHKQAMLAAE